MYKKYNFESKNLSLSSNGLKQVLEGLTPFLIIAATFIWLWK